MTTIIAIPDLHIQTTTYYIHSPYGKKTRVHRDINQSWADVLDKYRSNSTTILQSTFSNNGIVWTIFV